MKSAPFFDGRKPIPSLAILAAVCNLLFACAPHRPVLYPNQVLNQVGQAQAEQDIDACIQMARNYGAGTAPGARVAKDTAGGAAVGGASGAAVGAVTGNLGKGAAVGAAGAAAGAMTRSIIRSDEPGPVFRRFVEKCLKDKGYEPIGWQ
jgi:outer membrane lipoprotein SlyB